MRRGGLLFSLVDAKGCVVTQNQLSVLCLPDGQIRENLQSGKLKEMERKSVLCKNQSSASTESRTLWDRAVVAVTKNNIVSNVWPLLKPILLIIQGTRLFSDISLRSLHSYFNLPVNFPTFLKIFLW